jgi:hypothetical protein
MSNDFNKHDDYYQKRYFASPANLKYHLQRSGVAGKLEMQKNRYVFHLINGGELYWYPKDYSIELMGANDADKEALTNVLPCLKDE